MEPKISVLLFGLNVVFKFSFNLYLPIENVTDVIEKNTSAKTKNASHINIMNDGAFVKQLRDK